MELLEYNFFEVRISDSLKQIDILTVMSTITRIFLVLLVLCLTCAGKVAVTETLITGGSHFQLQWRGEFSGKERDKIQRWLQHAGNSAATLYGSLPRDPIRIVVQRSDRANEPVPFGHVLRDEPQGIRFLVNPKFPLQRFINDWTAVHELVHLYIPYPGERDIWLSEGLATYYQNLLQARAGVITEKRAWQKLYNGFARGQADNRYRHLSLAQLTPRMKETRSFMRVYWAGTSYFLQADLALRQQSQNRQSLDMVIRDFVGCCLHSEQYRNGQQLVRTFDKLAGSQVFTELYEEYRQFYAQPDPLPLLAQLGISISNKKVVLGEATPEQLLIRHAMTRSVESLPFTLPLKNTP